MTVLSTFDQFMIAIGMAIATLATFWLFIRLINRSTGTSYAKIWDIVRRDPIATAILRVGMYCAAAYLVGTSFSRFIG